MSGLQNDTFDGRDTAHLKYQGDWFLTGSYNASNVGQTGTLSSTKDPNANVTFTFPTPAIAFYYYGIRRCCGGFYGICIDCDPNNPNFLPIDAVNTTDDGKNPPVVLFSMTFKTPGIHEIIIRNQNDTRFGGNSQLTLAEIVLEVVDQVAVITSTITAPSSSSSSSSSSPTVTHTASSSPPVGAIVGGALAGGTLLICLLIPLFWLRLRRRRAALAQRELLNPSASPLLMPTQPIIHSSPETAWSSSTNSASRYGHGVPIGKHPQFPSVSSFPRATPSSTSEVPSQSPPSILPRRELDGGPLPLDRDVEEVDILPPEYGQVFAASGHRPSVQPADINASIRNKP